MAQRWKGAGMSARQVVVKQVGCGCCMGVAQGLPRGYGWHRKGRGRGSAQGIKAGHGVRNTRG